MSNVILIILTFSANPDISLKNDSLINCLNLNSTNDSRGISPQQYTVSNSTQTWFDAVNCCDQLGMRLAIVNSERDHDSLNKAVENSQIFNTSGTNNVWIGASSDPSGDFVWQATGANMTFSKWLGNEQKDEAKGCVKLTFDPNGQWHWSWKVEQCELKLHFACENEVKLNVTAKVEVEQL